MVLLILVAFAMIGLLAIVMIATTRHLLAHPEDSVHQHGAGSWSDGMARTEPGTSVPDTAESLTAARIPKRVTSEVPLDDMPAEVVAEAARRARERNGH